MSQPILSVHNLSTGYGKKQVLYDVSLDIMPGEIVLITGGNGSGKSTLLKAIYGLLPAWNDDAQILFKPDPQSPPLSTFPANGNLAKGLAYVPQKNAVFDDLTVEDNLRLGGHILRDRKLYTERRAEVLASLPMFVSLLKRKPEKLSGGERQMVALGMALLHRPKLLLLDEPTAGLSPDRITDIFQALQKLNIDINCSLIIVEHNQINFQSEFSGSYNMKLGKISKT